MSRKNCTNIGGQAVMEGVMMRGATVVATSVRTTSGEIITETQRLPSDKKFYSKIPILRGVINFFSSLVLGTKIMMRSAEVVDGDSEDEQYGLGTFAICFSVILGIFLSIGLFVILPQLVVSGLIKIFDWQLSDIVKNLISGVVRLLIFISYILLVSLMKDIKRVFMYHGAEHKTIACYEQGMELTVDNVRKCTRQHDRCGTNFVFIVMAISIIFFSLIVGWQENIFQRVFVRILLMPVVAGLSYEVLKFLAKFDNVFVRILKAPGLLLQKVTTSEPDDDMIEVAIKSFNTVLEMEADKTIPVQTFKTKSKIKSLICTIDTVLKSNKNYEPADVDWIICDVFNVKRNEINDIVDVSNELKSTAIKYAKRRASGEPLQYVLGHTTFFDCDIKVDKRVLIPRFDTELLADTAKKSCEGKTCLDLCTGSGCIGIVLKKNGANRVVCSDVSTEALALAKENAGINGVDVDFVCSDMFEKINEKFDIIVSNPPYIPSIDICTLDKEVKAEPVIALDGGSDGLDFYRIIARNCKNYLTENGMLFLEVGIGQAQQVVELLNDFKEINVIKDYSDIDRVIVAKLR